MAVKSAERVLRLIDLLAQAGDGLTFSELLEELGWPRSSLHGLVVTMVEHGYLTLDAETRRYRIGVRLWEVGQVYVEARDLERTCRPVMDRARDTLQETIHLAVLDGLETVYIAKVEAGQPVTLASRIGGRLPAYCVGLGKAMLAGLSDTELERRFDGVRLHPYTDSTITTLADLRTELEEIRSQGYAVDNGEYTPEIWCVAIPIHDHTGEVVAATSVSIPDMRRKRHGEEKLIRTMIDCGSQMSKLLGYSATQRRDGSQSS